MWVIGNGDRSTTEIEIAWSKESHAWQCNIIVKNGWGRKVWSSWKQFPLKMESTLRDHWQCLLAGELPGGLEVEWPYLWCIYVCIWDAELRMWASFVCFGVKKNYNRFKYIVYTVAHFLATQCLAFVTSLCILLYLWVSVCLLFILYTYIYIYMHALYLHPDHWAYMPESMHGGRWIPWMHEWL